MKKIFLTILLGMTLVGCGNTTSPDPIFFGNLNLSGAFVGSISGEDVQGSQSWNLEHNKDSAVRGEFNMIFNGTPLGGVISGHVEEGSVFHFTMESEANQCFLADGFATGNSGEISGSYTVRSCWGGLLVRFQMSRISN